MKSASGSGDSVGFNRNIIIQADVDKLMDPDSDNPVTLSANPPSGFVPALRPAATARAMVAGVTQKEGAQTAEAAPAVPAGVRVPTEDDFLTKLLKYVPVEVVGTYLFMAGVINSNVTGRPDHAHWLLALLIAVLVLTIPYDRRVLGIVRWSQVVMSVVGLAVYVFALGGWFATTTWYHQWYASLVVPVFGLLIAIFKLPPLPTKSG